MEELVKPKYVRLARHIYNDIVRGISISRGISSYSYKGSFIRRTLKHLDEVGFLTWWDGNNEYGVCHKPQKKYKK